MLGWDSDKLLVKTQGYSVTWLYVARQIGELPPVKQGQRGVGDLQGLRVENNTGANASDSGNRSN